MCLFVVEAIKHTMLQSRCVLPMCCVFFSHLDWKTGHIRTSEFAVLSRLPVRTHAAPDSLSPGGPRISWQKSFRLNVHSTELLRTGQDVVVQPFLAGPFLWCMSGQLFIVAGLRQQNIGVLICHDDSHGLAAGRLTCGHHLHHVQRQEQQHRRKKLPHTCRIVYLNNHKQRTHILLHHISSFAKAGQLQVVESLG